MFELNKRSILVVDIETDSLDIKTSKVKYVGFYSYLHDKHYELNFQTERDQIQKLLDSHKTLVTFNGTAFDIPILENNLRFEIFNNHIDLFQVSKQRLNIMGFKVHDYSLRTIAKELKLGELKGEVDYKIFQKDINTPEEIEEINLYLRQDIVVTKALLEYFNTIFESTTKMLSEDDNKRLVHLKASPASLSYRAILNHAGIKPEFTKNNEKSVKRETFLGAHHIDYRQNKVKGNIVSIDFTSMYPHMCLFFNLMSPKEDGWNGNNYFKLNGSYDNSAPGKIESSLKNILLERIEAKKNGNKPKNLAYKILINSFYGTLGNNCFKNTYNPIAAGDCTRAARTILKRLAATLEKNGFYIIYGFTDNVYVLIPRESSKEELMLVADNFIKDVQKNVIFSQDTFKLELDKEMKFIWFNAQNCYLYVDKNDKVVATSTLLNKNTPEVIIKLYNDYICPKIVKDLDVNFTEEELLQEILKIIGENIEITAEDFNTQSLSSYKVKTSLEYQISEKYGEGKHKLIPNISGVGVGKAKSTKFKIGVRYCTIEEFKESGLTKEDVDTKKLLSYLKPFISKPKDLNTSLVLE